VLSALGIALDPGLAHVQKLLDASPEEYSNVPKTLLEEQKMATLVAGMRGINVADTSADT
jgi:hypothetical protein